MENKPTSQNPSVPQEVSKKKPEKIKFGKLGIPVECAENRGNARDMAEYVDDFTIPTIEWMEGEIAMAFLESEPILVEGGTGIGKTRTVERMCAQLGYELYKLPCSSSTTEREMMGRYVSNPNKKSALDPEVIFAFGVIAEALREEPGKIKVIYLDEINTIEGAVGARLHDILDEVKKQKTKGRVKLIEDAGEVLEFDPRKVKIVATMNSADSKNTHAQKLSEALLRRFTYKRTVDELPDVEFLSIAVQKFSSSDVLRDLPGITGNGELIKAYSECHKGLQGLKRNNKIGVGSAQDFKYEDIPYLERVIKKVSVFWENGIFTDLATAFREAVKIIYTGMIVDEAEKKMMEEIIKKLDFKPTGDSKRKTLAELVAKKAKEEAERLAKEAEERAKAGKTTEGMEKIDSEISGLEGFARSKKRELDGETFIPEITAEHKTVDEDGKEGREIINIDFESKLLYSLEFFNKHKIKLPENFREQMKDVWTRNYEQIKKEIESKGFDEILLIPAGLDTADIHTKMSDGYSDTYKGGNFESGGSFGGVVEDKQAKIVLIHKNNAQNLKDHPELNKEKIGKKAEEYQKLGEGLSLTSYLIFQRQYFEVTGKHLDADGWTWLPGSTVPNPGGVSRVVLAFWSSGRLLVDADAPGNSYPSIGCRLSRSFF